MGLKENNCSILSEKKKKTIHIKIRYVQICSAYTGYMNCGKSPKSPVGDKDAAKFPASLEHGWLPACDTKRRP